MPHRKWRSCRGGGGGTAPGAKLGLSSDAAGGTRSSAPGSDWAQTTHCKSSLVVASLDRPSRAGSASTVTSALPASARRPAQFVRAGEVARISPRRIARRVGVSSCRSSASAAASRSATAAAAATASSTACFVQTRFGIGVGAGPTPRAIVLGDCAVRTSKACPSTVRVHAEQANCISAFAALRRVRAKSPAAMPRRAVSSSVATWPSVETFCLCSDGKEAQRPGIEMRDSAAIFVWTRSDAYCRVPLREMASDCRPADLE
eukprot:scaffold22788_cov128-Isochrysis_galbana.AAC.5